MRSLADWLTYQEQTHPKAIALGLERVRDVAARLGLLRPRCRSIIVGGTNGKGSSTALLAGIYAAAGYSVGHYSSPHLLAYNERVCLQAKPVADAALCEAFERIETARQDTPLSYFEWGTLAALWIFAKAKVDVQVLEVGLGGRLDAVNVIDADAALVTNIGLDHQDWLGEGRDNIGREKAGILRPRQVAVIADLIPPQGLVDVANASGATIAWRARADYAYLPHAETWDWVGRNDAQYLSLPKPALPGAHQLENAAAVVALIQAMLAVLPVSEPALHQGLRALTLPGRLQWQGRVLMDVSHNAEGAAVVADYLRSEGPQRIKFPGPLVWIAGLLGDKPIEAYAAAIAPQVARAYAIPLDGPRAISAPALAARIEAAGIPCQAADSAQAALRQALAQSPPNSAILVSGSFHTVAAITPHLPT